MYDDNLNYVINVCLLSIQSTDCWAHGSDIMKGNYPKMYGIFFRFFPIESHGHLKNSPLLGTTLEYFFLNWTIRIYTNLEHLVNYKYYIHEKFCQEKNSNPFTQWFRKCQSTFWITTFLKKIPFLYHVHNTGFTLFMTFF